MAVSSCLAFTDIGRNLIFYSEIMLLRFFWSWFFKVCIQVVCSGVCWNSFFNVILDWRLSALATNLFSNSCSLSKRGEGLEASPTNYLCLSHVVTCAKFPIASKVCFLQPCVISKLWMKYWKIFLYFVPACETG